MKPNKYREHRCLCAQSFTVCHSTGWSDTVTRHPLPADMRELVKMPAGALQPIARGFISSRLKNKKAREKERGVMVEGIASMCEGKLLQAFLRLTFSVPSQTSSLNEPLHQRQAGLPSSHEAGENRMLLWDYTSQPPTHSRDMSNFHPIPWRPCSKLMHLTYFNE